MKLWKFFANILLIIALGASSCAYDDSAVWDKLNDHENRISALEELCREMNTNISALHTLVGAMQDGDSFFADITVDKDSVTFTLTDGTVIVIPLRDSDIPTATPKKKTLRSCLTSFLLGSFFLYITKSHYLCTTSCSAQLELKG